MMFVNSNNSREEETQPDKGPSNDVEVPSPLEETDQEEFVRRMDAQRSLIEKMIDNISDSSKP